MTSSSAIIAAKAAQMAAQADPNMVTADSVPPQSSSYSARPPALARNYTDSGPPKPVYALSNPISGAWEPNRVPAVVSYTRRSSMDVSRGYLPRGDDTMRSGFHSPQPDHIEQRDETKIDPMAYGDDNRRQGSKERSDKAERNALERGAHKLKKRANNVGEKTRRDLELAQDEAVRYREEAKKWKKLAHTFEDENIAYQKIIERLKGDVEKEQARVEHTKRSANKMQTTMDNRELFLGDQAHDDDICSTFSGLMTAIKTWSQKFSGGKGNSFKEEDFSEYQRVTPLCSGLRDLEGVTSQKKRKRLFVRGWTAYIMSQSLFRTFDGMLQGMDVWLDQGLAEGFSYIEKALCYADRELISHRSFNDWRAFTAELLSKAIVAEGFNEKSDERTRRLAKEAVSDVMEVVAPWHVSGDSEELRADEDKLYRIFVDAVHFARKLRRQRALWSIRFASRPRLPVKDEMRTGPLMFDPTSMRDDRVDDEDMNQKAMKQCYVDIVVTPALYKRGTMNGERFESEEAAVPAVVVMGGT
ncbi:hypothetical protein EK21DRAFT_108275 [Setomelanomma holmii]|uniref:Uncharacterized protein n=1 Tax=Setomelanomma holmii TaxID=210430 RepID=A0A9P4HJP8_9PLEO|nr:hypothetical protein EK21DRAFT_108275 [Setomelanomma holmii]